MKLKGIFGVLLASCIIPFGQVNASSGVILKEAPNIEQLQAKKAEFNFTLYVDRAEIKAKGEHFELVVPKKPRNYQFIYQSTAPEQIAGTVPAEIMLSYWKKGNSFAQIPPMAIIIGVSSDVNFAVNITNMSDDGKNLVFDIVPFAKQPQKVKAGKYHTLVITIDALSTGGG